MTAPVDADRVSAFMGRLMESLGAANAVVLAALGDRLGLFAALAPEPATAGELATRAGTDERYTAEWAAGLTAAGWLEHDPDSGRFALPPEHAMALADEHSPLAVGGVFQNLLGLLGVLDHVTEAFRTGEGVPYAEYPPDVFDGMARLTGAAHENVLVPQWIPAVPGAEEKLRSGARVADVGCGQGRAVFAMASAFPSSSFVGFDAHRPVIERARARAGAMQAGDRVRFEVRDVIAEGLDGRFDLVWAFDVLHDASDPAGLLRAMRAALEPGGMALVLEPNVADSIEGNAGPMGAMFYGTSLLYCMSVSLATGGPGLGTCGTHERVVRELCAEAGFASVDEAPIDNPFNRLWIARP